MDQMEFIRTFGELGKTDADIAGGKGASLGEMTKAGIPVPPGYVILSTAFEKFLEETDLNTEIDAILHTVNKEEMHTVEYASEKIQGLILAATMPQDIAEEIEKHFEELNAEFVAVRSSATAEDSASAAWAGQLDSFLNTNKENLLTNVQRCFASLFTPRAIFYRFEKDLHLTKISVAVVVQKMVESECSGIAFSVHPVTEDRNQLIIEAGFGLGEAIVSGQVTPDSYVVEKEPRRIIDINVSTQNRALYRRVSGGNEWKDINEPKASSQVLTEKQILELSEIIIRIERHYGFPCDIEWAFEGGKFYIVQSRPITTLATQDNIQKQRVLTNIFSREKSLYYFDLWNICDRDGPKYFFGKGLDTVLFIVLPKGKKGSVWYDLSEMEMVKNAAIEKISNPKEAHILQEIVEKLHTAWDYLKPFALGKDIENVEELVEYQKYLLQYWSAMNSGVWEALESPRVSDDVRKLFVEVREQTEKYSERWSLLPTEFFAKKFPHYIDISNVITFDEMLSIAQGTVGESEIAIFKERVNGCFMIWGKVYPRVEELDSILSSLGLACERIKSDGVTEFTGTVAYKGVVKGKVRIVDGKKDMEKVEDGDILVTQMTNPEYVPVLKKAGGIVTDEGGALCHAAIVSRELKKPCVIGTKIATQVLKDGDLVEVDADNGVVKVIEKATIELSGDTQSVNSYVGTVDLTKVNVFRRLFTREYSVIAFYYWVEDILKHLDDWGGSSIIKNMLVLSEGAENASAGVYYLDPEIVAIFKSLQNLINTDSTYFKMAEERFNTSLEKVYPVLEAVQKKPTHENLLSFIEIYIKWYTTNVSLMHSLVDLEGIPEEVKNKALLYREKTQDLDASFARIVYTAVCTLYPEYADIAWYLLPHELAQLNIGLDKKTVAEIRERKIKGWYFLNGEFFLDKEGLSKNLEDKNLVLENTESITANEFKGTVAYKGIVKGVVRIISSRNQLDLFTEGEVLVTAMTNPDFVPIMKKAVAIVTDEGGMTCHAAIVAREMKKPCVIGTKIATQVLKDGDLVEVDAGNGVVKIIERSQKVFLPEEYEYTWGGTGFTILFQSLYYPAIKEYTFLDSFCYSIDNELRVYLSKESIEHCLSYGKSVLSTKEKAEAVCERTHVLADELISSAKQKDISLTAWKDALKKMNRFLADYSLLDPYFSDRVLEESKDPSFIEYLGKQKNSLREKLNHIFFTEDSILSSFVLGVAKKAGVSVKEIQSLTIEEIEDILSGGKVASPHHSFFIAVSSGVVSYRFDTQFVKEIDAQFNVLRRGDSSLGILKGKSVSTKGRFSGRVKKIILDYTNLEQSIAEANAWEGGYVLVAEHTTPELVPIMQKSSAIITEMGGMLSHAAITAREFDLPCIVGVKDARGLLSDGDLVEVDADNGVVKILERA